MTKLHRLIGMKVPINLLKNHDFEHKIERSNENMETQILLYFIIGLQIAQLFVSVRGANNGN